MYSCHLFLISSASVRYIPFLSRNGIDLLELTLKKKDDLFIIGNWNAKVGNQEIPEITGNFGLGEQNEAGKGYQILPRKCTSHRKCSFSTTQGTT